MEMKLSIISFIIYCICFQSSKLIGQLTLIGEDGLDPFPSAIFEVKSTDKGILIPRMSTDQRDSISTPAEGLLVYDTDESSFYYYNGSVWLSLSTMDPVFVYQANTDVIRLNDESTADFVFGSPSLGDSGFPEFDQRFYFDKSKAAFRAGDVNVDQWDEVNVGDFSVAFGKNTIASGKGAFAIGRDAQALGQFSFAAGDGVFANQDFSLVMGQGAVANNFAAISIGNQTVANGFGSVALGRENTAHSYLEIVMGGFATNYTANNPLFLHPDDRLFTIGNGTDPTNRSDAFMILKNGNTFINGALTIDSSYTFPTTDGANGQVLMTDGSGAVSWSELPSPALIQDEDNDTKIQVEASADEDIIRFDVNKVEAMTLATAYSTNGSILNVTIDAGGNSNNQNDPQWQSFTATADGKIDYFQMNFNVNYSPESGYSFTLYEGEGTNGTLLSSTSIPKPAASGWTTITFPDEVILDEGSLYTIRFDQMAGIKFGSNQYNDGKSSLGLGSSDFSLRVYTFSTKYALAHINGVLNINNAYSFPATAGTSGQILVTDSNGALSWATPTGNDHQTLALSGNTLSLTNGGSVDLSTYLDNTDEQTLSLNGDTLMLTNGGSVNLSTYLHNTDDQDLSLAGNSLTLTNDATPVDLSGFLDNTDNQALSLSGDTLKLTNGGSVTVTTSFQYDATNNIVRPSATTGDLANDDFVFGAPQLDNNSNTDHYKRFFFDKSKAAFRAGNVIANYWNDINIGNHSVAFGRNTTSSGDGSFAAGDNTIASNDGSFAVGEYTTASGIASFATGLDGTASGYGSFVAGGISVASGKFSSAFGRGNTAYSLAETTMGYYATNYTPNNATDYDANDRLFTIGNGTASTSRSDAFMVLKNGKTFINGALTIDSAYTLPTTDGTNGQALVTDGSGTLSWTSLTDSDHQDLSLSGNSLSLTNDASPVDLSGYLDNTDQQTLSLSGNDLSIFGGNTIDLSSINTNTNIYTNNGTITGERKLTFSGGQLLTLKRSDNSAEQSIAFQNSGTFYTSIIATPADGGGNDGGLDFRTKNSDQFIGSIGNTMRLTNNGTVTLPEYGQGNVTGTPAKMLAVESNGNVIEVEPADRIVYTFDQTAQTVNGGGWFNVSDFTGALNVQSGDVVTVRIAFSAKLQGGSGTDLLKFQVRAEAGSGGCSSISGGTTNDLGGYDTSRGEFVQTFVQHTFTANCSGTYTFGLQANLNNTDDDVVIDNVQITAVKY